MLLSILAFKRENEHREKSPCLKSQKKKKTRQSGDTFQLVSISDTIITAISDTECIHRLLSTI